MKRTSIITTAAMFFSLVLLLSRVQGFYTIQNATLTVYRDGSAYIKVEISADEDEFLITIPLLVSSEKIEDILVLNGTNELLDYDFDEANITIYSLGATQITLEYYTSALTFKEADLWTLRFNSTFELTVVLPENATIIYLSDVPSAIEIKDEKIILDLPSGEWEISYEIPVQPLFPSTPSPSQPPEEEQPSEEQPAEEKPAQPSSQPQLPFAPLLTTEQIGFIIVGIAIICIAALTLVYIKRKRRFEALRSEEIEVIRYLKERGGRALEAELRERFPYIPRTSMWRLVRRLERQGIVQVRKVGLQNVVELK